MSTLHVLSHSPFTDSRLGSCLRLLGTEDALLLCGDAVYAVQPHSLPCDALEQQHARLTLFILDEDLLARGLECPDWATRVDYTTFVELSLRYAKVNTWL